MDDEKLFKMLYRIIRIAFIVMLVTFILLLIKYFYSPNKYDPKIVETKSIVYVIPWPWQLEIDQSGRITMVLDLNRGGSSD